MLNPARVFTQISCYNITQHFWIYVLNELQIYDYKPNLCQAKSPAHVQSTKRQFNQNCRLDMHLASDVKRYVNITDKREPYTGHY